MTALIHYSSMIWNDWQVHCYFNAAAKENIQTHSSFLILAMSSWARLFVAATRGSETSLLNSSTSDSSFSAAILDLRSSASPSATSDSTSATSRRSAGRKNIRILYEPALEVLSMDKWTINGYNEKKTIIHECVFVIKKKATIIIYTIIN